MSDGKTTRVAALNNDWLRRAAKGEIKVGTLVEVEALEVVLIELEETTGATVTVGMTELDEESFGERATGAPRRVSGHERLLFLRGRCVTKRAPTEPLGERQRPDAAEDEGHVGQSGHDRDCGEGDVHAF